MFVEGGLHPEQIKALRQMSLQRRLDLALAGIESAGDLRKAMIHVEHPDCLPIKWKMRCAKKFGMPESNPLAIFALCLNIGSINSLRSWASFY